MISILNLGRCEYGTALDLQQTLVELRKAGRIPNVLLFVEHPPVITLGRNAKEGNIVAPRELLASRGVELFEINRGGDVTFHGPGQLVAYPIFDLRSFTPKLGVIEFVRNLEEVLMRVAVQYGIETQRIKGMTGVWTKAEPPVRVLKNNQRTEAGPRDLGPAWQERKIAAIGVHVSRGVTSHGFALNVTTDLDCFNLIVPCGLTKPVTSIELETGERPSLDEVMTHASRNFSDVFRSQVLWLDSIHDLIPAAEAAPPPQDTPAQPPAELRRMHGDDTHFA
ncbi:MAG TPA: lipoyl(octanoyl) transferase LipB [Clostridia bacterium]|nr:lipoyl(octanoyl) transferase LipB [Clostridia bacterium]